MSKPSKSSRDSLRGEKQGFTGWHAINTRAGTYVADFALARSVLDVVGVPGHDLRDFDFAEGDGTPVMRVVSMGDISLSQTVQVKRKGTIVNSDFLDGMDIHTATTK
jgi:leucyl-tRNA synthetase